MISTINKIHKRSQAHAVVKRGRSAFVLGLGLGFGLKVMVELMLKLSSARLTSDVNSPAVLGEVARIVLLRGPQIRYILTLIALRRNLKKKK